MYIPFWLIKIIMKNWTSQLQRPLYHYCSEIMKKEFIPFIMSWLQHMAHKKGQYVIVAYWKKKKRLLQVSWNFVIIIKISFVIRTLQPTLLGAHYTIIVWFDSKKTISFIYLTNWPNAGLIHYENKCTNLVSKNVVFYAFLAVRIY